jgi:AraC-like DNA-binding protein
MRFDFNFFSSILLIFFVHGLVYAILLFRKSKANETTSDKWLGIFLIVCILYISPWMLGFAGWYDNQPYRDILFYVPTQHLFFIGPIVFFYIQSLLNPFFKFCKKQFLHLIPGILYILYSAIMFLTDKVILKKYYFLASGQDPDFEANYQYVGVGSMLVYFFLSLRYVSLYKKLMAQVISYADTVLFKWVKTFLIAFLIMLIIRVLFDIAGNFEAFQRYRYMGSWWEFFSFAIVFYFIGIKGYSNNIETKVPFRLDLLENKTSLFLEDYKKETDSINIEEASFVVIETEPEQMLQKEEEYIMEWKEKLEILMQQEKMYEDPELSLTQVAKVLKTNPSIASKVINQGFGLNFNDFINSYRIASVKEMLIKGEQKKQTLLGIAYDCGFNSKATFNRAFKKHVGLSPKEWIEKSETVLKQ